MSELEELPSWAGRSVSGPKQGQNPGQGSSPGAGSPVGQARATPTKPVVDAGQAADQGQAAASHGAAASEGAGIIQERAAATTQHVQTERRRKPWRLFLFGLLGLLALVGMGALGYLLAQSQNSNETATSSGTEAADTQPDEAADGAAADADSTTDSGDAGDQAPVTVETEATDGAADDAATAEEGEDATTEGAEDTGTEGGEDTTDGQEEGADGAAGDGATTGVTDGAADSDSGRQAIFRGGKVYLSGPVPSEEVGQLIEGKAAAVVGPENVVNEYVIDPTSEIIPGSSAPLYVEDVVLFPFNSVEIAPPFLPILDLGTLLLRQNPQATITVVTRTDAVGSEEVNLDVSTKRAQAVINYWLSKGVDRDQIKADPRGEEGASEADDEEAAALRRRAEFIITGLLD